MLLLDEKSFALAFANLSLTVFGCGLLGFLGLYVGRVVVSSRAAVGPRKGTTPPHKP